MAHLFISYSRQDTAIVQRLRADLQSARIDFWIDQVGLQPGTPDWDEALREAISCADAVLLIASPASRRSPYVRDEVALARAAKKPIYPLWVAGENYLDCVPMGLGSTQNADLRGDNYASGLARVIGVLHGEQTAPDLIAVEPEPPVIVTTSAPRNPYKGLRAFREEDQGDFFGRESLLADLLASVDDARSVPRLRAVLGASGSGKSSVMMAGLLPALRHGKAPGSDRWVYLDPIVPGAHPVENLTITLARKLTAKSQAAIREDLDHRSRRGLHRLAREISDLPVILYIDQFEELFTLTGDEDERRQFVDLLTAAVTDPEGVLYLLLSMRADFYDRPAAYREFGALLEAHHTLITPMRLADLYDIVQKPAALPGVGLTFDDGLVTEMVFAVREEASALPLLQFTLDQLFERRDGNRLIRAAYDAIGGVKGALAQHAEDTYGALSADNQRLARALFLRLIEPGATPQETTRRRARLTELESGDAPQTEAMRHVADTFINARLLTADRSGEDETLEVSHEALIREWRQLGDWLHGAREVVLLIKRIAADADEWARKGQPEDALYRGRRLREAQDWEANNLPSANESAFIAASAAYEQAQIAADERRKEELRLAAERAERASAESQQNAESAKRQSRRARNAGLAAALVILVAVVGGVLAILQTNDAAARTTAAEIAQARAEEQQEMANAEAIAARTAEAEAVSAQNTSVAQAEEANAQMRQATSTLGYVQAQGTQVAAQATYFGVEQARIGTLSAGAVVIPPGTLTPELLLPTLTGVAQLRQWQPNIIRDDFGVEMVEVPPGCFMMGSVASGDEQPVHEQCFGEPFYIDRYEVTQGQFTGLGGQMGADFAYQGESRPVDNITWFEAHDFCREKRSARLPTEREWEYAARGPDSLTYPWGHLPILVYAVVDRGLTLGTAEVTTPNGEPARPNGASWVGALDLSGNVAEWTSTRYVDLDFSAGFNLYRQRFMYPYMADDGREEIGSAESRTDGMLHRMRVLRGGAWSDDSSGSGLRSADRFYFSDTLRFISFGFRCTRSTVPKT